MKQNYQEFFNSFSNLLLENLEKQDKCYMSITVYPRLGSHFSEHNQIGCLGTDAETVIFEKVAVTDNKFTLLFHLAVELFADLLKNIECTDRLVALKVTDSYLNCYKVSIDPVKGEVSYDQ